MDVGGHLAVPLGQLPQYLLERPRRVQQIAQGGVALGGTLQPPGWCFIQPYRDVGNVCMFLFQHAEGVSVSMPGQRSLRW